MSRSRKWLWLLVGSIGVAVLAVVVAPFVYIHFIQADPPARLSLSSDGTANGARVGIDGKWAATSASSVGYRINEVLFGQKSEAVGRTNKVTGQMVLSGMTVRSASFTVDMTAVTSDKDQRDEQFHGRIMDTATYPTATFTLTSPIELGEVPAQQKVVTATAAGQLSMHGTTKSVTLSLKAKRNGNTIEVNGSLNIVFADWGIGNPSFGPVTTEDHGLLEFLVVFAPA